MYNDKTPPFSSGLWLKTAILGPPKLPLGLKLRSMALGQLWRPSDGSFSRVPRKKVEFWPTIWRHIPQCCKYRFTHSVYNCFIVSDIHSTFHTRYPVSFLQTRRSGLRSAARSYSSRRAGSYTSSRRSGGSRRRAAESAR